MGTLEEVERINASIEQHLKSFDVALDFIYICPHLPEDGCDCRKPGIAMGLRAVLEFQLNPEQSFMVGDSDSDMIFGRALGCSTVQVGVNAQKMLDADYSAVSLREAADWILIKSKRVGN